MTLHFHTLTLTGWGQAADAIDAVVPGKIQHFSYHTFNGRNEAVAHLRTLSTQPDLVASWSLGGKIAAMAIAQGILRPKLFVMMSSSFQFSPGSGLDNATEKKAYSFYKTFETSPANARALLADIMIAGDSRPDALRKTLRQDDTHDKDWRRWIVNARFGFDTIDLNSMPPTLIIHGLNDALVGAEQAKLFKERIPHARLELLPGCGHLPHLHAPEKIAALIDEEWKKASR